RAVDNAIASTKMEGFEVTEEHRELIMKLMSGEITTDVAFEVLKKKYE
ncbi:MAG: antitoxin VbhA family protein, partial [Oscillospiraceae bacterium]|nr:antitoxin VbhA family protein [Oscillospiraceae bacterium]